MKQNIYLFILDACRIVQIHFFSAKTIFLTEHADSRGSYAKTVCLSELADSRGSSSKTVCLTDHANSRGSSAKTVCLSEHANSRGSSAKTVYLIVTPFKDEAIDLGVFTH